MYAIKQMREDELYHFGTLGMKWGVRKKKDIINSKRRTIKTGTEIQNISSGKYVHNKKSRLYASYTPYDKKLYGDMMGNFMYNERGYKNTFVVKKDIKLPSDKEIVNTFKNIVKQNPKQVASDFSKAYGEVHIFTSKSSKTYQKKLSDLSNDKKANRLAKEYVSNVLLSNKSKTGNAFYGSLIKQGFDAMSDVNDRDQFGGQQDPLIIFNVDKVLGSPKSIKLTKKELNAYGEFTGTREQRKTRKELNDIQR